MNRIQKMAAAILALCMMVFCAACGSSQTQADATQSPAASAQVQEGQSLSVTVKIECSTAAAQNEAIRNQYGTEGIIVSQTVQVAEGATVYDALKAACSDFQEKDGYVYKIGSLSAGDMGEMSGWMFSVNGEYGMLGAKEQTLSNGDVVEWRYTCDGGEDVGSTT